MRFLALLLAVVFSVPVSAARLDSLEAELTGVSNDDAVAIVSAELDKGFNGDSTYLNELLEFCDHVPSSTPWQKPVMHEATYVRAKQADQRGNNEKALTLLQNLEAELDPEREALLLTRTYRKLSDMFLEMGSPSKSLEYIRLAQQTCPPSADPHLRIHIWNALGETYRQIEEFEKAISAYNEGLGIAMEHDRKGPASMVLNNLGIALTMQNEFDSAQAVLEKGLAICEEIDTDFGRSRLLTNLGFLFKEQMKLEQALRYYERSIEVKKRLGNNASLAYSLNDLGEVLSWQGRYEAALDYSRKALRLATKEGAIYYVRDMNLTLSNTFELMGMYDSAYFYLDSYRALQDSVMNEDQALEIARLERLNEITETELENKVLKSQNEVGALMISRQRWTIGTFIAITLGLLLFGIMLYRRNRERNVLFLRLKEQNQALDTKNASLRQLLEEQESLFNIVTHDLKGPLSNILALIDLEKKSTSEAEESEFKFWMQHSAENAMHFISEFNLIHELESKNELPPTNNFDLVEMVNSTLAQYKTLIDSKQITIHFNPPEKLMIESIEPFVRHICLNVLSNALKFSPEGGSVFIAVSQRDDVRISIQDQGAGIAKEDQERVFQKFFRKKSSNDLTKTSNGLGLSLVKLLVQKLDGTIKINSSPEDGTEFIVHL